LKAISLIDGQSAGKKAANKVQNKKGAPSAPLKTKNAAKKKKNQPAKSSVVKSTEVQESNNYFLDGGD